MKRTLVFAGLMLGGLLMFPLAAEPKELPLDTPYSDDNTGVVFPAKLGKFSKTEIRINANPVVGTLIRYRGSRIGCSAAIYIYALDEKPAVIAPEEFRKHFEKAGQAVLNLKSASRRIEEAEALRQWENTDKNNPVRRELFSLRTDGEETYHSELLMLLCGDRVVKLRITVPASQKDAVRESDEFIGGFLKLFFPGKQLQFKERPLSQTNEPKL